MNYEEKTKELWKVLFSQNEVLDCMLQEQALIHNEVKNRNWVELQNSISKMSAYGDEFVELDSRRINLSGGDFNLFYTEELSDLFAMVRTKLVKSKIENEALSKYVSATRAFINGVIDECVPQNRNILYGPDGRLTRPRAESVVLNTVF